MSGPTREAVGVRVRMAGDGVDVFGGLSRPPAQVLVKKISTIKTRQITQLAVLYIARWRKEDEERRARRGEENTVQLYDEAGFPVPEVALRETLDGWEILPESQNLARLGETAPKGVLAQMPEVHRFDKREVEHFVWSVPLDQVPAGVDLRDIMETVTRSIVDEMFAGQGYRALWAVHLEHPDDGDDLEAGVNVKNPHAHILVRTLNASGKRLRITRDLLDTFRVACARHAQREGINVTATRREDREEVRKSVLNGEAPLRTNAAHPARGSDKTANVTDQGLQKKAPGWWSRHGAGVSARRAVMRRYWHEAREAGLSGVGALTWVDDHLGTPRDQASTIDVPKELKPVHEAMTTAFVDPDAAFLAFVEMALSARPDAAKRKKAGTTAWDEENNLQMAGWYLLRQPLVFGDITRQAKNLRTKPVLSHTLKVLRKHERALLEVARRHPPQSVAPVDVSSQPMALRADYERQRGAFMMAESLKTLADNADRLVYRRSPGEDFGYELASDRTRAAAASLMRPVQETQPAQDRARARARER